MIAAHTIKKDGRWYKAGEEIGSPAELMQNHEEKKITKTDIHRMPVEELRKLAMKQGIDGVENLNGSEIKKLLIEKMEM